MLAEGLMVQHFDLERDAEEEQEADQESKAVKAKEMFKKVAGNMAKNMTLGAITGAPGLVFGVGSAVATKAVDKLHERRLQEEGVVVTVSAVRASALYDLMADDKVGRKMSPLVKVRLLMDGIESNKMGPYAEKYRAKTAALHNIGTDLVFPPGKHEAVLSMPVKDAEKAKNACLLLTVEDEPEAAIGAAFRKVVIGTAIVALGQLFDALEENKEAAAPVNLTLLRGDGYGDFGGEVRVIVKLSS